MRHLLTLLFLVGTPIAEVPLQTIVATAEWAQLGPLVPGPAGTRGMTGLMTASEAAALRELLVSLGQRVDAADRGLEDAATEAEGPVATARRELDEAMRLLEQAHLLLDAAKRRGR